MGPEQAVEKYLQGRVAWVTGGASGMGAAIANALAERGAAVGIGSLVAAESVPGQSVHLVTHSDIDAAVKHLVSKGTVAFGQALNIGDDGSTRDFFDRLVAALGPVDILVNAAGSSGRHLLVDHPNDLWNTMLNVNLTGAYRTSKLCLPGMIDRQWGRIINIASTAANVGAVAHSAYCASKSGLLGLSRCIALEGARFGVSCNVINPGFVATPQNSIGMKHQMQLDGIDLSLAAYRKKLAKQIPQRRWIEASEIAALAAFLCQDDAFGITGQDLTVAAGSLW